MHDDAIGPVRSFNLVPAAFHEGGFPWLKTLVMVSCLAPNHRFVYQAMAAYLASHGIDIRFESDTPWEECERMLYDGRAHLGMLCGLPYVVQAELPEAPLRLVVAPVMKAPRYAGLPVYYTDMMVRDDSGYLRFEDLRGARWAYNEPNSHSGHNAVLWHLAKIGHTRGFFASALASGSHHDSLQLLLRGEVDVISLDSTFWEMESAGRPELARVVRNVQTLGPSPIQPLLAHVGLPQEERDHIAQILLAMADDPRGRQVLQSLPVERFVRMQDHDYDPIRRMLEMARSVQGA